MIDVMDFSAYVFESGQRFKDTDSVALRDGRTHIARHDRFDQACFFGKLPRFLHTLGHVGDQHGSRLIAVQETVPAVIPQYFNRHAVTVRIRSDQNFRSGFLSEFFRQFKSFRVFRIRITDCGKLRIRHLLLGNDVEPRVPHLLHNRADRNRAGAVERSVHDADGAVQLRGRMLAHALHVIKIGAVHLIADHDDKAFLLRLIQRHFLKFIEEIQLLDFLQHTVRNSTRNLRAVRPVHLVPVILLRVMARCHVYAGYRAEFPYGK